MQDSDFLDVFDEVSSALAKVNRENASSGELLDAVRKALEMISEMYDEYDEYVTERDQEEEEEDDEVEEEDEDDDDEEDAEADDDEDDQQKVQVPHQDTWMEGGRGF